MTRSLCRKEKTKMLNTTNKSRAQFKSFDIKSSVNLWVMFQKENESEMIKFHGIIFVKSLKIYHCDRDQIISPIMKGKKRSIAQIVCCLLMYSRRREMQRERHHMLENKFELN